VAEREKLRNIEQEIRNAATEQAKEKRDLEEYERLKKKFG